MYPINRIGSLRQERLRNPLFWTTFICAMAELQCGIVREEGLEKLAKVFAKAAHKMRIKF